MKTTILIVFILVLLPHNTHAQETILAKTPPMGWMSWNFFAEKVNEKELKEMAEAMIKIGMVQAGYNYIFIDDGWQGGRDNKNNLVADPIKFPSGMQALATFLHERGMKLGIYSDAAQLTCAGYTASLNFEFQDAKTFADWGVDYLKYDYCNAPEDSATAKIRYKKMADALKKSGRDIVLGICEWGPRKPWLWAAQVGGHLWRTTYDIRDKWKRKANSKDGEGILEILETNAELNNHSGKGKWNDADMLVVGLYGRKGPSGDLGGVGCTDLEYQSQFSLWAIMCSPLYATNDIRTINETTKKILLNSEVIAVNQDSLGIQAKRILNDSIWNVFIKPLAHNEFALAILNKSDWVQTFSMPLNKFGLKNNYKIKDLWQVNQIEIGNHITKKVEAHETKIYRLIMVKN